MNTLYLALLLTPALAASWAETTLQSLSLSEKIGQLFVVAAASDFSEENRVVAEQFGLTIKDMMPTAIKHLITTYHIGGIIFQLKSTSDKQIALTNQYQSLSAVPLLICQDAENGLIQRHRDALRFPNNMTLGALRNEQLIYKMGYEVGLQCKSIGVHLNCAPVVDVNNNQDNPVIHTRSFGDEPYRVARCAELFAQGLHDAGVIACAKHFPGHGDTNIDSHLSLPLIPHTIERLTQLELIPFIHLIEKNIPAIMTAHLSLPAVDATSHLPSSLSPALVTDLLQKKLGFTGLILTDGLMMRAVTHHTSPGVIELKAFLAGNDILLCPTDVPKAVALIKQAINEGSIEEHELDRRVLKILKAKERVGLATQQTIPTKLSVTKEARTLKKQLFSEALTLHGIRPLPEVTSSTPVIQIGGNPEECFTTHFSAISTVDTIRKNTETVIIALYTSKSSARNNYGITDDLLQLIASLKKDHPIIVVLFGSPYSLKYLPADISVLVAYENDTDAQCAAVEVITGNQQALGRLPIKI